MTALDLDLSREGAENLAATALLLARRYAAGATLWCWAPGAPEHAQHVAVEFVHPVIMGTRALPAVALLETDPVDTLRPLVRAGDVLLIITTTDGWVEPMLRRAEAWGATTIWLGIGTRPPEANAGSVLWISDDPRAEHDGRLVLGYHLLWELTHVCFEHPGLLVKSADEERTCMTCSDEGRLGEVSRCAHEEAEVRTATGVERVSTLMVGPVQPGDLVLVHAGTAITVVAP